MLVLTRRVGEEIVIDGDIRITIASVQGQRVRVGVDAPDCVRVARPEVQLHAADTGHSLPESHAARADSRAGSRELAVAEQVGRSLRHRGYPPVRSFTCTLEAGHLVLRGVVSSYHLKQVVQQLAQGFPEVERVDNLICVAPPPPRAPR